MVLLRNIGIGIVAVLVAIAIGLFIWLRGTLPDYDKTLITEGNRGEVVIERDQYGIPHIKAETMEDAAFGMGYAQAQDRMWQMEMFRRNVYGRLAEVLGASMVETDLYNKGHIQMPLIAAKSSERLDPETKKVFQAFADGVNTAIDAGEATSSPEWRLLGLEPEPWTVSDVNNFITIISEGATDGGTELKNLALEEKLPKPLFDLLMRTPDASIPTLYRDFGAYDLAQFQTPEPSSDDGGQQLPTEENNEAAEAPEAIELEPIIDPTAEESNGTNFFVFSGKKTTTGNAILAVDPHLPLDAPGLTYPMRIELPGEFIAGAAWVGTPTVVFGQNSHIAWGMTHLYADTFDYIIERVDPANPSQYLTPNGSLPFETENITINVKGGDPVTAVVRKTRNGIVVSDRLGDATPADGLQDQFKIVEDVFGPGHVVVRRQLAGVEGHSTVQALLKMSQARSWQVFQDAVRDYEWTNNIVYADVDGNIGVQFSARLPNREKLNGWNGQRLARGWLGEGQWNGYVPFEDLPTILNPEKGWAADSNGRAIDPEYPVRAEETFSPPWRVSRAYDLIEKSPPLDVDAITKIQTDTVSAKADALLRYLLDLDYANPQSAEAIRRLSEWDRNMDVGRVEPTLYSAIELALQHRILNQWGKPQARDSASAVQLIRVLSSEQRDQWCDDHRTDAKETCEEIITASVDDAMGALSKNLGDDMSKWRWGDHHVVDFNALYSWAFIPVLKDLFAVRVETPGGDSTLNQGASDRELDLDAGLLKTVDFSHDHGASFRLVADLSDPSKSVMSFAPGVSGNALSPHWRDMAEVWARGEYISLLANGGSPKTVTRLVPKER